MGIGNFLFVPISMMVGRRAVFLFNNVFMLVAIIWAAKSDDFTSHLAARCLQGLACGISDCLVDPLPTLFKTLKNSDLFEQLPIMILDMTFLHRRGLWMGKLLFCIFEIYN